MGTSKPHSLPLELLRQYLQEHYDPFEEGFPLYKKTECESARTPRVHRKSIDFEELAFKRPEPVEALGDVLQSDSAEDDYVCCRPAEVRYSLIPKAELPPLRPDRAGAKRSLDTLTVDQPFGEMLRQLILSSGMENSEFQQKANMIRATFSNLISGKSKPNKSTVFSCIIALCLPLKEAEALLSRAGYAFSSAELLDMIVKCFVEHGVYDIDELNDVLVNSYDLPALGYMPR